MKYKIFGVSTLLVVFALFAVIGADTQAKLDLPEGTVIKGKSHKTLYYFSEDGKRYVFPNEKTFKSWYDDFNNIVEVDDNDLGTVPLGGNVRYKPGVYLVKITTDPKVYAVSGNGRLRWLKNERVAKALYGDNWNLLVDDVSDAFFVNYAIDEPIEDDDEFNPNDEEQNVKNIDENRRAAKRYIKQVKTHVKVCDNLERQFNKLQDRLAERGIVIDNLGDDFLNTCVSNSAGDDNDDSDDYGVVKDGKVRVCHKGDNGRNTISIAKSAVKAHLKHGDKVGVCPHDKKDDGTNSDTTPPVITYKSALDITTDSVTITWDTDESSKGKVYYSVSSPVLDSSDWKYVADTDYSTSSHSVTLTNLVSSTKYYYLIKAQDKSGNLKVSDEMNFTTDATVVVDETAPVISDIVVTTGSTTTTIAWNTDEAATSKVTYADSSLGTASSTAMVSDGAFVTLHSLNLTGLATSTQYFFKVESKDAADNTTTSSEDDFTTSS